LLLSVSLFSTTGQHFSAQSPNPPFVVHQLQAGSSMHAEHVSFLARHASIEGGGGMAAHVALFTSAIGGTHLQSSARVTLVADAEKSSHTAPVSHVFHLIGPAEYAQNVQPVAVEHALQSRFGHSSHEVRCLLPPLHLPPLAVLDWHFCFVS
jgi:hypothetical protein